MISPLNLSHLAKDLLNIYYVPCTIAKCFRKSNVEMYWCYSGYYTQYLTQRYLNKIPNKTASFLFTFTNLIQKKKEHGALYEINCG